MLRLHRALRVTQRSLLASSNAQYSPYNSISTTHTTREMKRYGVRAFGDTARPPSHSRPPQTKGPRKTIPKHTQVDPTTQAVRKELAALSNTFIRTRDVDDLFERYAPSDMDPELLVEVVKTLSTNRFILKPRHVKHVSDMLLKNGHKLDRFKLGSLFYHTRTIPQLESTERLEMDRLYKVLTHTLFDSSVKPHGRSASHLAVIMHGLQNATSSTVVDKLLRAITNAINTSPHLWKGKDLGMGLYGLKNMENTEAVKELLSALISKMHPSAVIGADDIASASIGLQHMSASTEVLDLFSLFRDRLCATEVIVSEKNICNILYSLHSKQCSVPEVRVLLHTVTDILRSPAGSKMAFNSRGVSSSLYGLRSMKSTTEEVRNLLEALQGPITRNYEPLTARSIGDALYGLQGMSPEHPEVANLLSCLTSSIKNSKEKLSGRHLGKAVYGLKNMSSDYAVVRELVYALADRVSAAGTNESACPEGFWSQLNEEALAGVIYGLRNMKNDCVEVDALLEVIARELQSWKHLITISDSSSSILFGLRNMTPTPSVRLILSSLAEITANTSTPIHISRVAPSIYGLMSMNECDEVMQILAALDEKLCMSTGTITNRDVAHICFGLQGMCSLNDTVKSVLATTLDKALKNNLTLHAIDVAMVIYGLKSLPKDYLEVKDILTLCCKSLNECQPDEFDHKQIAMILVGLANCSSNLKVVSEIVVAVTRILNHNHIVLPPHELSTCLFGLKSMTSAQPEVKDLIAAVLAVKSAEPMTPAGVARALCGMQSLNSHHQCTKELAVYLASQLHTVRTQMTPHEIAIAMFGMKSLSSEHAEIRHILGLLGEAIQSTKEHFTNQELSIMFDGLSSSNDRSEESMNVLQGLANRLDHTVGDFTAIQLTDMLHGLQGFSSRSVDIKRILRILTPVMQKTIRGKLDSVYVNKVLFGLQRMDCGDDDVVSALHALGEVVASPSKVSGGGSTECNKLSRCSNHSFASEIDALRKGVVGLTSLCQIYTATISPVQTAATMRVRSISVLYHHITTFLHSAREVTGSYDARVVELTDIERRSALMTLEETLRGLRLLLHYSPNLPADLLHALDEARHSIISILQSSDSWKLGEQNKVDEQGAIGRMVDIIKELSGPHFQNIEVTRNVCIGEEEVSGYGFHLPVVATMSTQDAEYRAAVHIDDRDTCTYPATRRLQFLKERYLKDAHGIEVIHVTRDDTDDDVARKVKAVVQNFATKSEIAYK